MYRLDFLKTRIKQLLPILTPRGPLPLMVHVLETEPQPLAVLPTSEREEHFASIVDIRQSFGVKFVLRKPEIPAQHPPFGHKTPDEAGASVDLPNLAYLVTHLPVPDNRLDRPDELTALPVHVGVSTLKISIVVTAREVNTSSGIRTPSLTFLKKFLHTHERHHISPDKAIVSRDVQ